MEIRLNKITSRNANLRLNRLTAGDVSDPNSCKRANNCCSSRVDKGVMVAFAIF